MKRISLFLMLLIGASVAYAIDCKQPLDADTLKRLQLGWTDVQLHPGDTHQFSLAILSTYAPSQEVPACTTWKVEPEGKGASISNTGLLKIDPKTPVPSKFVVTADIEQGREQRQMDVFVYNDDSQPLVGRWRQQSMFDCDTEKETKPGELIQELEFRARGWFSVTWTPFEVYRDYWGSYTTGKAKGDLSLQIEGGNFVPKDFRGSGHYKLKDNKTLELIGAYLDEKSSSNAGNHKIGNKCRYIFTRIP